MPPAQHTPMANLRRKNSKQTVSCTHDSPEIVASAGSTPVPSDNQLVADDVLQLLERASTRAEVQIQHSHKVKAAKSRRTAKVLRDAESMISTEVLLDIAKRRKDVGEVLCSHCSKSIQLADALPTASALQVVPRTSLHRKGPFVIVPERPDVVQPAVLKVQQSAVHVRPPLWLRNDPAIHIAAVVAALPADDNTDSENSANSLQHHPDNEMLDDDVDGSLQHHLDNEMLDDDVDDSLQHHLDNEMLDDEVASPTSPLMDLEENATNDEPTQSQTLQD